MKNKKFSNLFENNRFLFVVSLGIAMILWGYVVSYENNEHTTTIHDVPIDMRYRQSAYQSMGLDVIETNITTVNVSVTGPRSVTGTLTKEDIIVYPNITGIDGSGVYEFKLTAEPSSSVRDFTINSISRETVSVRLDKLITKEFPVEVNISSLSVDEGYMADRPITDPAKLTITGPEFKVNRIDRIAAVTTAEDTLTQTQIFPSELHIYDENDAEMDSKYLSFSSADIEITIPIMKEVRVPVKVEYVNVPAGFDTETLTINVTPSTIRLAVPSQTASAVTDFVAGYIDVTELITNEQYTFDLKLPLGYRSLDEVKQVFATVSGRNLDEKVIDVSEIKVINDPDDKIEVLTEEIKDVVIVGDKSVIDNISKGSVIAQIDAARLPAAKGQQSVEVEFIIPSTDKAFVKGIYTVTIKN